MRTEYAGLGRGVANAYEGLAKWAGVSLGTVAEHARDGRLGELVETRQHIRPLSGSEALRRLDAKRQAPGTKSRSPHALIGELRALKAIWDAEEDELRRRRDPHQRLAELRTRQVPSWWSE
jgi:hypothetical protein